MKNQLPHLALAAFVLSLAGCASSSIKQTWKSPDYQGGPVRRIALLAVDERDFVRVALENRFALEFGAHGQDALATHKLLGLPEIKADRETAAARIRESGADTVLIIRMVDETTHSREVRARPALYVPTVSSFGSYGWYDYYSVAYADMGVIWGSTTQNIYIDSSLFDLKTGRRLWSALTLTTLKQDTDRLVEADSIVTKVANALRNDGLVHQ